MAGVAKPEVCGSDGSSAEVMTLNNDLRGNNGSVTFRMWCYVATGGAALVAAAVMGVLMTLHGQAPTFP